MVEARPRDVLELAFRTTKASPSRRVRLEKPVRSQLGFPCQEKGPQLSKPRKANGGNRDRAHQDLEYATRPPSTIDQIASRLRATSWSGLMRGGGVPSWYRVPARAKVQRGRLPTPGRTDRTDSVGSLPATIRDGCIDRTCCVSAAAAGRQKTTVCCTWTERAMALRRTCVQRFILL